MSTLTAAVDWHLSAICRREDPLLFFSDVPADQEEAREVCAACPVRDACLAATLTAEGNAAGSNRYGIYGGLDGDQRRALWERDILPTLPPGSGRSLGGARALAPCGTAAAYRRHQRRDEPIDDACRQANNAHCAHQKSKKRATA